jgi:Spo0E like sporulation regulatory protein.
MKIEKQIEDEIEKFRYELEKKIFESEDLNNELILEISRKLDDVIVKYIRAEKHE